MKILDKIVSTSERLFMNHGFKSTSMDDIATELRVSKKTIYKHIHTKDNLIYITLSRYLENEKAILGKIASESDNAVEEIIGIGRHIINITRKLKPALIFDLKKYGKRHWQLIEEHHFNFIQQVIMNNLERGVKEALFRKNIRTDIIAKLYVGKSIIIADESNFPLKLISWDQLLKEHLLYHLYGVLSEEGIKLVKQYEIETL